MAKVMKLGGPVDKPALAKKEKLVVSLEEDLNQPPDEITRYSWLIYGNKGIGKTSITTHFPNPILLAFEPGFKGLKVNAKRIPNWEHTLAYIDALEKEADSERTVIVDTVDLMYDYAFDHECARLKISSPTEENDFGATWRKIRKMFRTQIERLLSLPGCVIFISHDTEKEIDVIGVEGMEKKDRVQPTIAKQGLQELEGLVDMIGYYGYDSDARFMWIDGAQTRVGKCRPEDHFLTPSGDRVKRVPMGLSSKEAFANLNRAFDNKQETADGVSKEQKPKKSGLHIKKS